MTIVYAVAVIAIFLALGFAMNVIGEFATKN